MADFGSALLKAMGRFKWIALAITVSFGVLWWILDQYAGNHVTDYLDSHAHEMWLWVESNPTSAAIVAGIVFVAFCSFVATRDELIKKFVEFMREPDAMSLGIVWKPGESVFVHSYKLPPDTAVNVEFRVCVVNNSPRTTLTDIRVRLQDLRPYELPCVPCGLRLMNNTKEPFTDRFDLHPGEEQFVSLFVQKPNGPSLWFLHTTPGIDWAVPAQPYSIRIVASCGPARAEQSFEVIKNGLQWEMRAIDA